MSPPSFLPYNHVMRSYMLLFVAVCFLLTGCAAPSTPLPATTPVPTLTPLPNVLPPIITPTSTGNPMQISLRDALTLVDSEARSTRSATTIAEARRHAEAIVNMLVGLWGRWYGDADGDGTLNDPLQGVGILPGERVPGPAPDVGNPTAPIGLALLTYSASDGSDKQVIAPLFGDIATWQSRPRSGFDAIDNALKSASVQGGNVGKLAGPLPRLVAYGRLLLTQADNLTTALRYSDAAIAESSAALTTVSKLR